MFASHARTAPGIVQTRECGIDSELGTTLIDDPQGLPATSPRSDDGVVPNQLDRQVPTVRPAGGAGRGAGSGPAAGELVLSVAAVARRLGVAPATLRTWDRRYGLGPAEHEPGAHRRYGPADIARLETMQRALLRGAAPAEAARYALAERPQSEQPEHPRPAAPDASGPDPAGPDPAGPDPAGSDPAGSGLAGSGLAGREPVGPGPPGPDPAGREPAGPGWAQLPRPTRPVRVGGRSLRLPGSDARARGLARAAVSLDAVSIRRLLEDSLAAEGVITTWDLVVRPVLGAIANCWEDTGAGVEIEHLLSECALGAFRNSLWAAPPPGGPRPVLLACVPDELHSLPLYPLSAALTARGIRCRMLGAALPADALASAVRRTAPSAVFLWAQMAGYAAPDLLAGLPRIRPRVRVFAGGPGWAGVPRPATAELVDTLTTATDRIAAAVGSGPRRRFVATGGSRPPY